MYGGYGYPYGAYGHPLGHYGHLGNYGQYWGGAYGHHHYGGYPHASLIDSLLERIKASNY